MHVKRNDLNAKSRMKGDFHVRFREKFEVKVLLLTRLAPKMFFGGIL